MRKLVEDIFEVGVINFDAKLFDRLIPLPDGTSYNAYLVKGSEKTVLIDTVDPDKTEVLIDNLVKTGITKIDYIIAHHAEQDHSGSLPDILLLYPEAKIVTNPKCKSMLMDLLSLEDNQFQIIEDGSTLSLGDKTLQFIYTPWVHWPETFSTYLPENKILFSCDFFGSHFATSNLFVKDIAEIYEPAKRYFAEIMLPFRSQINKNIEKIKDLDIEMIAPSHGPVHNDPQFIIDAYKDWSSEKGKNLVIIPYVSMHGSTSKMVTYLLDALIERGIEVKQFELSTVDIGKLAISLVDCTTVVIGTSTVLMGPHPCAAYAAFLANALRPKFKFASVIGSYGWGGKTVETIASMLTNFKGQMLDTVLAKGEPKENDYLALEKLADDILQKHKEIGVMD